MSIEAAKRPVDTMPKGDDGVMDNLDSRVERVEVFNAETRIPQAKPVREADALAGVRRRGG